MHSALNESGYFQWRAEVFLEIPHVSTILASF